MKEIATIIGVPAAFIALAAILIYLPRLFKRKKEVSELDESESFYHK